MKVYFNRLIGLEWYSVTRVIHEEEEKEIQFMCMAISKICQSSFIVLSPRRGSQPEPLLFNGNLART
jgi:hypothetical protein